MAINPKSPAGRLSQKQRDRIVRRARQRRVQDSKDYREQSLRIHPWVCARCGREFTRKDLHLLTVHHKDHDHENNPPDGSNWENLCIYCHDNEHRRYLDHLAGKGTEVNEEKRDTATYKPFAGLGEMLKPKKK